MEKWKVDKPEVEGNALPARVTVHLESKKGEVVERELSRAEAVQMASDILDAVGVSRRKDLVKLLHSSYPFVDRMKLYGNEYAAKLAPLVEGALLAEGVHIR